MGGTMLAAARVLEFRVQAAASPQFNMLQHPNLVDVVPATTENEPHQCVLAV